MRESLVVSSFSIKWLWSLPLLIACTGCDKPLSQNEDQLHAKALSLPLRDRYDLYLKVYKSRIPRNPLLADDVAALGEPARRYAFKRAASGQGPEFGAALSIISAFDIGCSREEMKRLVDAATREAESERQLTALKDSINSVCRRVPPKGWR
jgi:hypothetical protein